MKSFIMYQCETCGKQSREKEEIEKCEADHLGLTLFEYREYRDLERKVEYCGYKISSWNNEQTRRDFDDAINNIIDFEKQHGLLETR